MPPKSNNVKRIETYIVRIRISVDFQTVNFKKLKNHNPTVTCQILCVKTESIQQQH